MGLKGFRDSQNFFGFKGTPKVLLSTVPRVIWKQKGQFFALFLSNDSVKTYVITSCISVLIEKNTEIYRQRKSNLTFFFLFGIAIVLGSGAQFL